MNLKHVFLVVLLSVSLLFPGCKAYYKAFYTEPEGCFAVGCVSKPYDVIIVPGYPSNSGTINGVLKERITWAVYLYKTNFAKHIIFSGAAVYSPYIEAEVMRLFAIQQGVPPEVIYTETKAEHTTENLYYSNLLAQQLGFKKVAFASHASQTSFMKPFKRKFKLSIDFLPIVQDTISKYSLEFLPLDASSAFKSNFISIIKRQNKLQRLRGTQGHKVKNEMRRAKRKAK